MNRFLEAYVRAFQRWMPSPLAIAILLTAIAVGWGLAFASPSSVLRSWTEGMWNPGLVRFGFQAMFMLVLGHVLALSPPVLKLLHRAVGWILRRPGWAAPKLALLAMLLGWVNWGLGLVGGAILVRGVLDASKTVNRGLMGAAGYAGMLVWHGGLSGSAPLKVAESGHLSALMPSVEWASSLPDAIGLRDTIFSIGAISLTIGVAAVTFALFRWLDKSVPVSVSVPVPVSVPDPVPDPDPVPVPDPDPVPDPVPVPDVSAHWADGSRWLSGFLGLGCFAGALWWSAAHGSPAELMFITPDWINLVLLGGALLAHGTVTSLLKALDEAISGAAGILIQFPIYFGIMGIVTGTGLGEWMAGALVEVTSRELLPSALFASSAVLNVFVPSGGGQWAVQGPLVLEACWRLGVPLPKGVMAMAFGDQLTNMLQPFWAIPLLGISGLKARDILPYTLVVMLVVGAVMLSGMVVWGLSDG
jgi:short-chain fatty acids transporter